MTGRVEAVCVSGADLLALPGRRPNRTRHRQAAGQRSGRRPPARSGRRRPGQPQAPRRRGPGGLRLRPGGRRLLDRRARPRAAAGPVRREPAHDGPGPASAPCSASSGGSGRRCSRSPPGASRAPTSPASGTSRTWSSGSPPTAPPARTCGFSRPARSVAGDAVEVVFRPDHGITVGEGFRIARPPAVPAARTRTGAALPAGQGPAQAGGHASRSGWPRGAEPRRRATVRRGTPGVDPVRRGGRRVAAPERSRAAGRWLCWPARRWPACSGGSLVGVRSRPARPGQDHPGRREDRALRADQHGRPRHRHRADRRRG